MQSTALANGAQPVPPRWFLEMEIKTPGVLILEKVIYISGYSPEVQADRINDSPPRRVACKSSGADCQ